MASADIPSAPPLSHILETVLYVRDVQVSAKFYTDVLQTPPFIVMDNVAGFALGTTTLLLFKLGGTDDDRTRPGGMIPKHGPTKPLSSVLMSARPSASDDLVPNLRQHFCFAVSDPGAVKLWDERLQKLGIKIRSRMDWQAGGKSVYFEDPDGHVGEIGSRGLWAHYPLEED
ncbi:hypothetical protein DIZ76_016063 [Coccidioides immitis]|nr:hypothetical protein DIZ76_016063 [Coccidioides immitis]